MPNAEDLVVSFLFARLDKFADLILWFPCQENNTIYLKNGKLKEEKKSKHCNCMWLLPSNAVGNEWCKAVVKGKYTVVKEKENSCCKIYAGLGAYPF